MQKLFFIFPITGPNNGVKVISNHIKKALDNANDFEVKPVNTAQAKNYSNFGKFSLKKISSFLKVLKSLFKIKTDDAVYLNFTPRGYAFYRDLIILAVCNYRTKNVTIHIHANGLEKKFKFYNRSLFLKAKIIVINKAQKEHLENLAAHCFLVPNALPDYYKNNEIIYRDTNGLNLIFLSNISKEKGIYRLEKIAQIIGKNQIKCHINVYGGALDKQEKQIIFELNERYEFLNYHGVLENDCDKFRALQKNDVLLFLSDENYEVSPLVYIEALMSGLFIWTTNQIVAENLTKLNVADVLEDDLCNFVELTNSFKKMGQEQKENIRNSYFDNYSFSDYVDSIKDIILNAKK